MEDYKRRQKVEKIIDFLETLPEIEFFKSDFLFWDATVEVILDFLELKSKNYKYYPWAEKIMGKKIELFGV